MRRHKDKNTNIRNITTYREYSLLLVPPRPFSHQPAPKPKAEPHQVCLVRTKRISLEKTSFETPAQPPWKTCTHSDGKTSLHLQRSPSDALQCITGTSLLLFIFFISITPKLLTYEPDYSVIFFLR